MGETKYDTTHHAGATPEVRIANRLKNSGDTANVQHSVVHGTGPTRAYTNIHHSRVHEHGKPSPGEGNILGERRGSANPKGEI
jgi:hypothetical protein